MSMTWEAVIELVEKYWVQQACVLVLGIITW